MLRIQPAVAALGLSFRSEGVHPQAKCVSLLRVMKNSQISNTQSIAPFRTARLLPVLVVVALASSILALAQAPVPGSPALEAKAHAWLAKLNLEQKVELIGGID